MAYSEYLEIVAEKARRRRFAAEPEPITDFTPLILATLAKARAAAELDEDHDQQLRDDDLRERAAEERERDASDYRPRGRL